MYKQTECFCKTMLNMEHNAYAGCCSRCVDLTVCGLAVVLCKQENHSLCRDCHFVFPTAVEYQNLPYISLLHWLGYMMTPNLFTHIKE